MQTEIFFKNLPALLCALFASVLFIQSGLDKVLDWKGNLEFLKAHFAKTVFKGSVAPMLATITVGELATGLLSAVGIIYFLATGSPALIFWAALIGSLSITALFFGQRVAKDYPGAAVLVPYFLLMIVQLYLSSPFR